MKKSAINKQSSELVDDALDPEDGEAMADFIDRCADDLADQYDDLDDDSAREVCRMKWEETADDDDDDGKEFADPGYRADSKKRYALDTVKQIRRSWFRIYQRRRRIHRCAARAHQRPHNECLEGEDRQGRAAARS